MELSEILPPEHVLPAVSVQSRKSLFELLTDTASTELRIDRRELFAALMEREKLGCTGYGGGLSIPHARLGSLSRVHAWFLRLETPIDFDAPDGRKVDLVAVIFAPLAGASDHLKALNAFARRLREPGVPELLRQTTQRESLHRLLTQSDAH